ncbi:hypothetical protein, partial [Acidithiobacillus ferriphilus]
LNGYAGINPTWFSDTPKNPLCYNFGPSVTSGHDATFGERANELSEMIEENILAASREGAAIVSGAVEESAQATGERILAQIEKFSGVVRRVEYLAYAMVIGVVILSIGILLGRFL